MDNESLPEQYQHTVNTFNQAAELYLEYFKDFKLYQQTYDWLLAAMNENHAQILDIACGPGQVDYYLLQSMPDLQITGIDLAPKMITLAKKLNPACTYQIMDCREIDTLATTYDVIICGFCLPYLCHKDMTALLQTMTQMVQSNGLIYLSTITSEQADGYQTSKSAKGKTFVHYHDIELIKSTLQQAGCSIIRHEHIIHVHNDKEVRDEFVLALKLA
ncbi:MAG: class I SAM-dependent methyltransferase [Marinicella sp.]|nr:class I SAM-dependent methyltransferase [Xanthomonadales bacterium]